MPLIVIEQPDAEPISLTEAQAHCRVDSSDDADYLTALIEAARDYAEWFQGRTYITRVYELSEKYVAGEAIALIRGPVQTVDAVSAADSDGVLTALTDDEYTVDMYQHIPTVTVSSVPTGTLGIVIEYTAGYGDEPSDVPQRIRQAILLLIGHWYEHREAVVKGGQKDELPHGVAALLNMDDINVGIA
jgi:uncharacterized phiE125 gp8 family phage protein